MVDYGVRGSITGNIVSAIRGFAVMKRQSRPPEDAEVAGERGRTRAATLCLLTTTRSSVINAEKPVTKFGDDSEGGTQSKRA